MYIRPYFYMFIKNIYFLCVLVLIKSFVLNRLMKCKTTLFAGAASRSHCPVPAHSCVRKHFVSVVLALGFLGFTCCLLVGRWGCHGLDISWVGHLIHVALF